MVGRSGLDKDHERLRQDSVVRHPLGGRLALHRGHDCVHVWYVHQPADTRRVLGVDEKADVRHAKRPEQLLTLGRGEPMICPSPRGR